MPTDDISQPRAHLKDLDGLRAIASLLVVGYHLNSTVGFHLSDLAAPENLDPVRAFVYSGHTGVTLFFILSAFLLSLPHFQNARPQPGASKRFFRRRALRILPLYWVAIAVAMAATAQQWQDLGRGVPYLFFLNGFGLGERLPPYSSVWWSLATEAQFYVLLPLLPIALRSRFGRIAGLVSLLAYALLYIGNLEGTLSPQSTAARSKIAHSLFGRGSAFLVGIAVAALYVRFGTALRTWLMNLRWLRSGGADALLLVVLLALGLVLRRVAWLGYFPAEVKGYNHAWHIPEALLWGAVLFIVLFLPLGLSALLRSRPFVWAGEVSYSTYIWHLPLIYFFLMLVSQALGGLPGESRIAMQLVSLASIALILVVSGASYRWIERPFLRRKERMASLREL